MPPQLWEPTLWSDSCLHGATIDTRYVARYGLPGPDYTAGPAVAIACTGGGDALDIRGCDWYGHADTWSTDNSSARGGAWSALVTLPAFSTGYVTLVAAMPLTSAYTFPATCQNELRIYGDGTLAAYTGDNRLICASDPGVFPFGVEVLVDYRTHLDGYTLDANSSGQGFCGFRLDGTLVAEARALVNGAYPHNTMEFWRFGNLNPDSDGAPQFRAIAAGYAQKTHGFTGFPSAPAPGALGCFHTVFPPDFLGVRQVDYLNVSGPGLSDTLDFAGAPFSSAFAVIEENEDDSYGRGLARATVDRRGAFYTHDLYSVPAWPIRALTVWVSAKRVADDGGVGFNTINTLGLWTNASGGLPGFGGGPEMLSSRGAYTPSGRYFIDGHGHFQRDVYFGSPADWTATALNDTELIISDPDTSNQDGYEWRATHLFLEVLLSDYAATAVPAVVAGIFDCPRTPVVSRQRSWAWIL